MDPTLLSRIENGLPATPQQIRQLGRVSRHLARAISLSTETRD